MWQRSLRLIRRAVPQLRAAKGKNLGHTTETSRSKVNDSYTAWYIFSRWTVAYSVCALVEGYVVAADQAAGSSMEPTIPTAGALLIVEKITPWLRGWSFFEKFTTYKRGSVVLLIGPSGNELVCKRIIGLPGDILLVERKQEGNGQQQFKVTGSDIVLVPPGHIWVQGDNGTSSLDSRYYGCVSQGLIIGTALFRLWPPGFLRRVPPSLNGSDILSTAAQ
ncbi:signal peptidase i protein [Cystoisospora suis]|uniref:Mitochondrial inner membrane protease subunit n=1 Tax=Cystoisospora suis TaxID=483139 RepID=A0A2C6L325_9APIC|nr:signal peptidase i protein [Cystoisospora suis]